MRRYSISTQSNIYYSKSWVLKFKQYSITIIQIDIQSMEEKLNHILNTLVKISTKLQHISPASVQSLLYNWTHQNQLVDMAFQLSLLIDTSMHSISPQKVSLQQQLQKQEAHNRQLRELVLLEKIRVLEQEQIQTQTQLISATNMNRALEGRNSNLQIELSKSAKTYSLQLDQKQLLINKLQSKINILNGQKLGKGSKQELQKDKDKEKLKKMTRHKRGKSDDPITTRRDRYKGIR